MYCLCCVLHNTLRYFYLLEQLMHRHPLTPKIPLGRLIYCKCFLLLLSVLYSPLQQTLLELITYKVIMLREQGSLSSNSFISHIGCRFCRGSQGLFGGWCSQAWWGMGMKGLWWAVSICSTHRHTHLKGAQANQIRLPNCLLPPSRLSSPEPLMVCVSQGSAIIGGKMRGLRGLGPLRKIRE